MKKFYTLFSFIAVSSVMCSGIYAQTDTDPLYILLADESGMYADTLKMTPQGADFKAESVVVNHGFVFYARSETTQFETVYSMPAWAVTPAVISWQNPLSISSNGVIDIASGTYDISFISRDNSGVGYHTFKAVRSGSPDEAVYPPSVFIMDGGSEKIEIPGTGGVYEAEIAVPSSFIVTYEPYYRAAAFVFGPAEATENTLADDSRIKLSYMVNAGVNLRYAGTDRSNSKVIVDLRAGSESISVGDPTSAIDIDSVVAGHKVEVMTDGGYICIDTTDSEHKAVYSSTGLCVYSGTGNKVGPYASGLYFVKVAGTVAKVMVR